MANKNPNMSGLKPRKKIDAKGTHQRPVQVRVPKDQYDLYMSIPAEKRNSYLRQAITELLEKENLLSA